jgi:3-hydroxyacyl-[acyl-carrier-protein] dehydratase
MHFALIDTVLERSPERLVAIKQVSLAEEYLQDHFPDFPVLPGVMMLEAMVQAGRELVGPKAPTTRLVLGQVRALKYGKFVQPGRAIRIEVTLNKDPGDGTFDCKGEVTLLAPAGQPQPTGETGDSTAASGRFTLRPLKTG